MKRKQKTTFAIVMAAFMAASLPWQADKAFASDALDVPEAAVNAETAIAVSEVAETGETSLNRGDLEMAGMPEASESDEDEMVQEESAEKENTEEQETVADTREQEHQGTPEGEAVPYADGIVASGKDRDITWTLNSDGLLTISGTGDFSTAPNLNPGSWRDYSDYVTSAEVKVTGMTSANGMFSRCTKLTSVDLSGFDTSNLISTVNMFSRCSSLTSLDLSGFDTSNVTDMTGMFDECIGLTNLNLSGFDTSNVTKMRSMFDTCRNLTSLDLSSFDTSNVTDMTTMFAICSNLVSLDLSGFDTSKVTDMGAMFADCTSLTDLNLSGFDTGNVTATGDMFNGCSSLTSLDLSGFDTGNVTNMKSMFSNCSSLANLDLSSFDTSKVTSMESMFINCSSLTNLDLSSFDTSKVRNMYEMFFRCTSLAGLDLSSFDTGNVTEMGSMFYNCNGLTSLDLSSFNTSNATSIGGMFYGCSGLTSLDLSSFNTSNATSMGGMFYGCTGLTSLDLSKFDMRNAVNVEDMLSGCNKLEIIHTPLNLTRPVAVPTPANTVWRLPDSTETTMLPQNLEHSIKLCREYKVIVGIPAFEIADYVGGKEVIFKSATQEAVIYYSDKPEITTRDKRVKNGGRVKFESFSGTLYARAYANGQWSLDTASITLNIPKTETPTISISKDKIIIQAPTEGSTIYYTTDGSTPTLANGKNAGGTSVTIDTLSGTVKAIAVKSGYGNSQMARKVLQNSKKTRNTSFAVKGVFGGRNVTFDSQVKGAKIYYSPTKSTLTTTDKCVNAGETVLFEDFYGTIYARTFYNGEWGNPCRLILKIPVVNTPTVSVDSKGYATIRTTTPGTRIYYTTDGSTPSMTNGKMVSSPYVRVYVGKGKTVKAIAVRSCFTHSKVGTGK